MAETVGDDTLRPATTASSAERFAVDSIVAGRYRIERFIAAGGMGEVYAAHDLVLDGTVALKTLRPELEGSAEAIARLRREIALARNVSDPHICRLHDVGEHDGRVFLSMELLVGRTLAELVGDKPFAIDEVERIAAQLIAGLGALHRASIIHRDFKTANVIVVGDGRAVITDFGLARSIDAGDARLTLDSGLLGTPAYMAPEQVEARAATRASDIYSLGVVLFELLTGKLPFDEDTAMATATARLRKDPPKPSSLRSDVPARWDAIVMRCLEREPSARFSSVDEILAHKPMSRRWLLGAGGAALAAGALGVWKFALADDEPHAVVARSPDDIIALVPVRGEGDWLRDPWRSAISYDVFAALASVGVPMLAYWTAAMDPTWEGAGARLAAEQDPVGAALKIPKVVTAVTMMLARTAESIEIVVSASGRERWTRTFRRPANEVASLVHEVATAIAGNAGYALPRAPSDVRRFDAASYERYGAALASMFRRRTEEEEQAIEAGTAQEPLVQLRVLAKERPDLTRAVVLLADIGMMHAEQHKNYADAKPMLDRVKGLANRVLAVEPWNGLAYAVLGHAAMIEWDWKRAVELLERARELAPTHDRTAYRLSFLYIVIGRFDDGVALAEQIHARNPDPRLGDAMLAWHYGRSRRWPDVIRVLEPVIDKIDMSRGVEVMMLTALPRAYAEIGRYDEAVALAEKLRPKIGAYAVATLLKVYTAAGRTEQARKIYEEVRETAGPPANAAMLDALGDIDGALTLWEQVVDAHNLHAQFLKIQRVSPPLRSHPRYQALLERIGFPAANDIVERE